MGIGAKFLTFILTALLCLAAGGGPAFAADYYVSPTGNDSNPGTLAAPWKSPNRAQRTVRAGDTVYFRGGDYVMTDAGYSGSFRFLFSSDGTAAAPITYKNYNGEKPVIVVDMRASLNDPRGGRAILTVSGGYSIIDGLHFRQTETSRVVSIVNQVYIPNGTSRTAIRVESNNVTIRNCSIDNFSAQGILYGGTNGLVEKCKIFGTGGHGFYISGRNGTFRYNELDGSRGYSLQYPMQIQYQRSSGNKIYGNLVKNGQAGGVVFSGMISNNEVFNNVFINAGSRTGSTGGSVVGFWCEDGPIGPGNKFYNNTAIGKTNYGFLGTGSCKTKDTGELGRRVEVYNNIFHPSAPARAGMSTPLVRNNIYYNIIGSIPPNNTLVNPNLANPSGTTAADAMLQAGSPAIDKAPSGAPALDYQAGTRPVGAAADIGAFEHGAPPGPLGGPVGSDTGGGTTTPPLDCPPVGIEAAGNPFAPTAPGSSTPPVMTGATTTPLGTGKNYYMSPNGNDSNPGTEASPWKTIYKLYAVQNILRPGDTVWFRGGDYIFDDSGGRYYYPLTADGTASAPIIYRNYQGEKPVIVFDKRTEPPNATDKGWGVALYVSGNHTIFDGLHFRQTEESRRLATTNNDTYHDRNAMARGIVIYPSNVIIRNCSLDNFSGLGIATPGDNILVEHCSFTNGGNHYLYLQGPGGTFRYNYMDGSRQINGGRPIQIQYDGTDNNKIYGNFIINGSADAVVFSGQISGNEVFNNIIVNGGSGRASGYAVGFWCEDGPMGSGNKFYNNTVIGRSIGGVLGTFDPSPTSKCRGTPPMQPVDVYNNIFYPSTPVRALAGTATYPKLRNNIFYNITGSVPPGNTLVNPNLANLAGTTAADAMLQAGSPAIDKAVATAPALDYQGGTRPVGSASDIGAYEFGAPPGPLGGPVGGGSGGGTGGISVPPGCPPPFVPDTYIQCIPPDP